MQKLSAAVTALETSKKQNAVGLAKLASVRKRKRRLTSFALVLVVVLSLFIFRLIDIQLIRASAINVQAEATRAQVITTYGSRGEILDAEGSVLADSVIRYDVTISPLQAKQWEDDYKRDHSVAETAASYDSNTNELATALGMSGAEVRKIVADGVAKKPPSQYELLAKLVSVPVRDRVQSLDISWVYLTEHPIRRYPNGAVAGNLVGFTDEHGTALAGLELSMNNCLLGQDGKVRYVNGAGDGIAIPGTTQVVQQAQPGGDLKLTINSDLQWAVQKIVAQQVVATGAQWASVVVMDAKTGKLLAVADTPTLDPNDPVASPPADRGSRTFTGPFEPGSTFKALTASILLDAGLAKPTDQIIDPYRYNPPNGARIADDEFHEDEQLTLAGVLVQSSNTGMSIFGDRMDDNRRYEYLKAFGLGNPSAVGFLGEEGGTIHDSAKDWDNQTKYATMFGQGLTTTQVQMASIYQTIANNGLRMPVQLVESCGGKATTESASTQVISKDAANQTAAILERVYLEGWLAKVWNIPGYRVAAKTGTAQVADGNGGYLSGYLVSATGFAPADDPRFVVAVSLMDPVKLNSSAAAAPVFRNVMQQALKQYRVVPSGAPAPEIPTSW